MVGGYAREVGYATLADAVAAAKDGETVTVIADHELVCNKNPLITVNNDITINFNGKVVTADVIDSDPEAYFIFKTSDDAKLTISAESGNGGVVINNGEDITAYMFCNNGEMEINGGKFILTALNGGAMFFSENSNMVINGGTFYQYTNGWMFNTRGNGVYAITVNGGTFNRNFLAGENATPAENTWGEAVLHEGYCLAPNSAIAGTWIVKTSHKVVIDAAVEATCTTTGLTEGSHCSACGEVLVAQTVVDALGHTEGAAVVENNVDPDCTTHGTYDSVVYCTVCDEELSRTTVVVPALGHTEGAVVVENNVAPDCTTYGTYDNVVYCTVCNVELSRITVVVPALGHTVVVDAAVEATCTTTGLTEGSHCSVCNEVLVAQVVIPVAPHSAKIIAAVAPTCTDAGNTAGVECEVCGYVYLATQTVPALGHTWVDATLEAPKYCSVCGITEGEALKAQVAQIGDVTYESLAAALAAAQDGDTIVLLANVTENVTVNGDITIDGANFNYTGTMTVANGNNVTIQNVNFVKGSIIEADGIHGNLAIIGCDFDGVDKSIGYAVTVRGADNVIIEDSTAKNYSTGMLYIVSNVDKVSVKDVEISNVAAAFNISRSNNGTFENVTVTNATYGLHVQNYSTRTYTLNNCDFECTYPVYVQKKGEATVDFELIGDYVYGKSYSSNYTHFILADVDATLTADEGLNVTTNLPGYGVEYVDGTYVVVGAIAQNTVTGTTYATLAEALAAAQDGETVILLANTEEAVVMVQAGTVLDLNGYTIEASYVASFGDVIDSSTDKTGLMKVDAKRISLLETNSQMPVYVDEGYKFLNTKLQYELTSDLEASTSKIYYRPSIGKAFNTYLSDGADDNGLSIVIRLTWDDVNNPGAIASQDFVFTEDLIKDAYSNGKRLTLVINDSAETADSIKVEVMLISDTGVIHSADIGTIG